MSEDKKTNLPEVEGKDKNAYPKRKQWIIGIILGLVTSVSIYFSSIDYPFLDTIAANNLNNDGVIKLISFIDRYKTYLFLVVFLIVMFWIKGVETRKNVNLRTTRLAYMVGMVPGLILFLILALTTQTLIIG